MTAPTQNSIPDGSVEGDTDYELPAWAGPCPRWGVHRYQFKVFALDVKLALGARYSFGYPACPNLEDQAKLWPLMEPGRINIELSEEFQLEPEQSTSAIIAHHPEARYFNVRGAKTDAQLAARIGEV